MLLSLEFCVLARGLLCRGERRDGFRDPAAKLHSGRQSTLLNTLQYTTNFFSLSRTTSSSCTSPPINLPFPTLSAALRRPVAIKRLHSAFNASRGEGRKTQVTGLCFWDLIVRRVKYVACVDRPVKKGWSRELALLDSVSSLDKDVASFDDHDGATRTNSYCSDYRTSALDFPSFRYHQERHLCRSRSPHLCSRRFALLSSLHRATRLISICAMTAFLGIPYAQPPITSLRLRQPSRLTQRFTTPRPAQSYPPHCPGFGGDNTGKVMNECVSNTS